MIRSTLPCRCPSVVAMPSRVPAIWVGGLNFHGHAKEVKLPPPEQPIFVMKPSTAAVYPTSAFVDLDNTVRMGNEVLIPPLAQSPPDADYEGELAVVIGKECKNVPRADVDRVIAGFTVALDITARRRQGKRGGNQWCHAKAFDTWCPLGPRLVKLPCGELPALCLSTYVNDVRVQHAPFSDFIFDVPDLVSFLSQGITLPAGTVILTGTPAGVGFVQQPKPKYLVDGDRLAVEIDRIGRLDFTVKFETLTSV
jgi:2-keto-4-pentenoate hydratase/2-oxohepta-3-ene-1,7-dioic acid hydratase in catechol pathway